MSGLIALGAAVAVITGIGAGECLAAVPRKCRTRESG